MSKKMKNKTAKSEKALILENVNKKYKMEDKQTFQALYDVSVAFDKGELVSIVGESGSGKSTLMNLIGGLDSDFTGKIIAGGESLHDLSESELDKYRKNKVGFVFQSFNLIPHLSILDNVTLALTLSNVSEHEKVEKATKVLTRLGLKSQLKKKPNQLSGGQKQRVAIARALINDPEIIIADEPTGALDSATSMQILEILKEIADDGKLVIMVTHSEKVASVSSRVVEISDGRIISDHLNENYQKSTKSLESETSENFDSQIVVAEQNANSSSSNQNQKKKKVFKNYKDRQNLSFFSAFRLSLHNMWASKVKNFLMAFGVGIGIASLILMLCFSSGLTDYINDTMKSFSDPTIVTITKKSEKTGFEALGEYNSFDEDEISALVSDINTELTDAGYDFQVTYGTEDASLSYGVQMYTISMGYVIYDPDDETADGVDISYFDINTKLFNSDELDNYESISYKMVYYLYTIPPYYTSTNVLEGEMSTSSGGVMFSSSIYSLFDDGSITNDGGTSRSVDVAINYNNTIVTFANQTITGVMDASMLSSFMVLYIDYDYFQELFAPYNNNTELDPNTLYIQTNTEEEATFISNYLTANGYSGSIENTFATMFNSMLDVVGYSLIVLSSISLLVSAIMILVVLYMSVTERTKEIGVLKSIGARRKDIRRIFTSESFLIGLLSGIVGILFNLLLTAIIAIVLNSLIGLCPISYRWWYFVVAIGVAVVISMIAGLYPANKAAKLDPVESLRRE